MIDNKNIDSIVSMIHAFRSRINNSGIKDQHYISNFLNLFLISVAGQLCSLRPDQDFRDDQLLALWAELGYFGIERDQLPDD
jgi:hypothetical protein